LDAVFKRINRAVLYRLKSVFGDVVAQDVGGSSGGRSRQVGVSIYDRDYSLPGKRKLVPKWKFDLSATFIKPQSNQLESTSRFRASQNKIKLKLESLFAQKGRVLEANSNFKSRSYSEIYAQSNFVNRENVLELKAKWNYSKLINLLESYVKLLDEEKFTKFTRKKPPKKDVRTLKSLGISVIKTKGDDGTNLTFRTREDSKVDCTLCKYFNRKNFKSDDPNRPVLPLHPNCRCVWQDKKSRRILGQF
jgi:hypothetical protein